VAAELDVLDTPRAAGLVARGGALRIAGFAAGLALSLVAVVLVTRHLGVADYGRYQSVVALVAVVTALADAGLGTLALREHAQRPTAERESALRAILGLRLVLAVAGVAAAAGLAVVLGYDATMVAGAALAAGAQIFNAAQSTLSVPLQARLRLGTITALDLGRQAITAALVAGLVVAGAGLLAFLAAPVPAAAVVLVATAVAGGALRPALDPAAWAGLLRVAGAVGLATAAGVLYLYTSLLVCGVVADPRATGWFSTSFRVIIIVAAVPALLGTSAFPLLARAAAHDRARLARTATGLVEASLLLGGAATLAVVLGAPAIIDVVAGAGFGEAVTPLRIQGAALGLTFVIAPLGFTLLACDRQRALLACNALAFAVSVVAVGVLASAHGEKGAAIGAALGELTLCTAYAVAVLRDVPLRPAAAPRIVAALAAGLLAGVWIGPAVVAAAVGLVVYAAAVTALGALPPQLATRLRRPPRPRRARPPGPRRRDDR
jgi:O-antigen/teichoic acid export membrane protein